MWIISWRWWSSSATDRSHSQDGEPPYFFSFLPGGPRGQSHILAVLWTPATPAACRRFLLGPGRLTWLSSHLVRNLGASVSSLIIIADLAPRSLCVCVCALLNLTHRCLATQVANYEMDRDSPLLRNVARRSAAGGRGMLWQPPTLSQTHPHFCYYSNSLSFFCFSPPCSCPLLTPLLLFLISFLLVRCLLPFHPSLLFIFHSGPFPPIW